MFIERFSRLFLGQVAGVFGLLPGLFQKYFKINFAGMKNVSTFAVPNGKGVPYRAGGARLPGETQRDALAGPAPFWSTESRSVSGGDKVLERY